MQFFDNLCSVTSVLGLKDRAHQSTGLKNRQDFRPKHHSAPALHTPIILSESSLAVNPICKVMLHPQDSLPPATVEAGSITLEINPFTGDSCLHCKSSRSSQCNEVDCATRRQRLEWVALTLALG